MKIFALFLLALVGLASAATVYDEVLDKSTEEVIASFVSAFETLPLPPSDEDSEGINEVENDAKSELVKSLREALAETIAKIKKRVDERHENAADLIKKAEEITDRLKDLHKDVGEKSKELAKNIKNRALDLVKKLIEKISGLREKRDVEEETVLAELEFVNILEKVKAKITEKVDLDAISAYIRKVYGQGSKTAERLIKVIKARGTDGLVRLIDAILRVIKPKDQPREKRALTEIYNRVADFLRGLGEHLLGRYAEFAEWLSTVWTKAVSHAKNRHEQLMAIAKEVIQDAKDMHKETIREAIEILRPYRKELGNLWSELLEAAKKALSKPGQ